MNGIGQQQQYLWWQKQEKILDRHSRCFKQRKIKEITTSYNQQIICILCKDINTLSCNKPYSIVNWFCINLLHYLSCQIRRVCNSPLFKALFCTQPWWSNTVYVFPIHTTRVTDIVWLHGREGNNKVKDITKKGQRTYHMTNRIVAEGQWLNILWWYIRNYENLQGTIKVTGTIISHAYRHIEFQKAHLAILRCWNFHKLHAKWNANSFFLIISLIGYIPDHARIFVHEWRIKPA